METIDQLTHRANVLAQKARNHADAAGTALLELRERIKNKASDEGAEWGHNWKTFCVAGKLDIGYKHANRLISFVRNPETKENYLKGQQEWNERRAEFVKKGAAKRPIDDENAPLEKQSEREWEDDDPSAYEEAANVQRQFSSLKFAWEKACPEVREQFRDWIARKH